MSAPTERGDKPTGARRQADRSAATSRPERGDNGIVIIRDAVAAELPVLQGIDVATGQMFRDIGMPEGYPVVLAACLTADSNAGSGSQPSCDQMILPDALTRANQG